MVISGIYKIVNKENGKCYIGSSVNVQKRLDGHFKNLLENKHINIHLQNAYNIYGYDAFDVELLEECDVEMLTIVEQYYIDMYWDSGLLYNMCPTANSMLGYKHTENAKTNMSNSHIGHTAWNKGLPWNEEVKEKFRFAKLNNVFGEDNPFYGKKHSEETKRQWSTIRKGKVSPMKGKKQPASVGIAVSNAQKGNKNWLGKKHSEETKRKISESKKKK